MLHSSKLNTDYLKIKYYTLLITSILFYIESIIALGLGIQLAISFGTTGLGLFAIWTYHIVATIILAIICLMIFLTEFCLRHVFNSHANININKKFTVFFIGGFILPILTIFIIPILGIAFDIVLNQVGVGKLFPLQTQINNVLQNKNNNIPQKELDRINQKQYRSYEELKEEKENRSLNKKQVIFYQERITPNGIEKSMIIKPNKNR